MHVKRVDHPVARILPVEREVEVGAGEHHRLGGQDEEAAAWFRSAGDHARTLFATADALAHYQRALALDHPDPGHLHARVGELRILTGDWAGALAALEAAAARTEGQQLAAVGA